MRANTLLCSLGLTALLALGSVTSARADLNFNVSLDTSALVGGSYFLDFQLNDGDGVANNSALLSNFLFGGGSAAGSPVLIGGASGSLGAGASLLDTDFLNELTEGFTPGSTLSFDVSLTTNMDPGGFAPDQFSFAILDDQGNEIPTTNPNGSFISVDLDSSTPTIVASAATGNLTIPAPQIVVPEPNTMAMLLAGGLMGGGVVLRRRRR